MAVFTNYTDLVFAQEHGKINRQVLNGTPFTSPGSGIDAPLMDPFRIEPSGITGMTKQIQLIARNTLTGDGQAKHGVRAGSNVNGGLSYEYTMSMLYRFLPAIMYAKIVRGEMENVESTGLTASGQNLTVAFSALDSTQLAQLKENSIVYIHDQANTSNIGFWVLNADASGNSFSCSSISSTTANPITPEDSAPSGDKKIYVSVAGKRIPTASVSSIAENAGELTITFNNAHGFDSESFEPGCIFDFGLRNPDDDPELDNDERTFINALTIAGATGDRAVRNGANRGSGTAKYKSRTNTTLVFERLSEFLKTTGSETLTIPASGNLDLISGQFYRNVPGTNADNRTVRFTAERTYPVYDDDENQINTLYRYTTGLQLASMNFNMTQSSFINGGITMIGKDVIRKDVNAGDTRVTGFSDAVDPIYDLAMSSVTDIADLKMVDADGEELMTYINSASFNISKQLTPKTPLRHRNAVRVNKGNFGAGVQLDVEFDRFVPFDVVEINDKAKCWFSILNPQGKLDVDMGSVQLSVNAENNNPGQEIGLPISGTATGSNDFDTTVNITKTHGRFSPGDPC